MKGLGRQLHRALPITNQIRGFLQYVSQHEKYHVQAVALLGLFHVTQHLVLQGFQLYII